MRLISLILSFALSLAVCVRADFVSYSSCDKGAPPSTSLQQFSWRAVDDMSSTLSYHICPLQPDNLRYVADIHLSVFDGNRVLVERVLPICRSSPEKCIKQLDDAGCLSGELHLRIPVITNSPASRVRSTVTLNESSDVSPGLVVVKVCSS